MAIDASIPLGIRPPQFENPQQMQMRELQIADLMAQQQDRDYVRRQQGAAAAQEATIADLYRTSGGDAAKVRAGMFERGLGARVPAFDDQQAKTGKAQADTEAAKFKLAKDKLDMTGAALSSLLARPQVTPDDVIGTITALVQRGAIDPDEGARLARSLPPDPAALRRVLMGAGMEVMDASKRIDLLLPKTEVRNMGGQDQAFSTDQLTGQVTPGQTFGKTASPDAMMADARMRSEGAANRAVQMRGQDRPNGGSSRTGPMSVTLQKELLESDDAVKSSESVIRALQTAKAQNETAYSGYFAKPSAALVSNLPGGGTKSADATIDIDNLMTGQGLDQMKAIFGAAPTEGERKILMDMQASVDKTPKQRAAIMDRAIAAAERRAKYAASKAAAIRSGSYLTEGVAEQPTDSAPAAGAPAPGAVQDGYRFKGGDPADQKNWEKV